MSITVRGVKFQRAKKNRKFFLVFLVLAEFILSFFVYLSFAAHIVWPEQSKGAVGVAKVLSYEGRLTDTGGNPLGGTGTQYCFLFSIYDSASGGSKLWPSGTPATTTATVIDGVFDVLVGSADSLTYNFYTSDTIYLDVAANTTSGPTCTTTGAWESLSPRQRIAATGYAITSANVYGDLLKTDISNSRVQIGTGTGSPTINLALDVKNSSDTIGAACSPSGTLWYNSNVANYQTLVCDNGFIVPIGNSPTTTLAALKEASAGSAISTGTAVFSGINGISISQNAQTLSISGLNAFGLSNLGNTVGNTGVQTGTIVFSGQDNVTLSQITGAGGVHTIGISAAGGGGGGATLSFYANAPAFLGTGVAVGQSTSAVGPFIVPQSVSASYLRMPILMTTSSNSLATTANTTFTAGMYSTFNAVVYSLGAGASSRSLRSVASGSAGFTQQWSLQANANGSQYSLSFYVSYPFEGANTNTFSSQLVTSLTNFSFGTGSLTRFTSVRNLDIPFANSLSAGAYWLVYGMSTSSAAQVAAATSLRVYYSANYGLTQANLTVLPMGNIANASIQMQPGVGSFTTAGGGTTASLGLSNVSSRASHWIPYFIMIRQS